MHAAYVLCAKTQTRFRSIVIALLVYRRGISSDPFPQPILSAEKPVPPDMVAAGEFGRILLDTNTISPILDKKPLSQWLITVLEQSSPAVCRHSMVEYSSSSRVEAEISDKENSANLAQLQNKSPEWAMLNPEELDFSSRAFGDEEKGHIYHA
ncbi:hypothetical protein TWF281_010875 [Arthrobotrys megalospora]